MIKRLFIILFIVAIAALAAFGGALYYAATGVRTTQTKAIEISQGSTLRSISLGLSKEGVIKTPQLFEVIARMRGLGSHLKAGEYEFAAGMTLIDILGKLQRGEVKQYPLTIIEGQTIADIALSLSKSPFATIPQVQEFIRLCKDTKFIADLGINAPTLEGYLSPDTYFITKPFVVENFIKRLVGRFKDVWNSLDANAIKSSGLTDREILTLASIVEKETGSSEERPLIAGVFLGRLKIGMLLQSDPTIIYGLPNFDGNIRKSDILNPHKYNTYVHAGLPPGPICNPSKAAIEAVIKPTKTNYLFFVSRNNGTHIFSESMSEHSKAVREYQQKNKGK